MSFIRSKIAVSLFGLITLLLLTACGGGSGTDQTPETQQRGTVGILLTDAPADPSMFLSINASIESAELLGEEDDGRVSLYSGPTQTFDLLRLRSESIPFTFNDDVPAGTYCKIRLTLSKLELVLADDTPEDSTDNETFHPHLPGNGKLDLVARDCFDVGAGEVVTIQLDIDAGNSIHVVGNGNNRFNFRPVVFVDVLNQEFDSKLVRVDGVITEIDDQAGTLLLCGALPTHHIDGEGCVEIVLVPESAFFDNIEYSGAPRALDELLLPERLEQTLTVVGWPQYWVPPMTDDDADDRHRHPMMVINALALELGEFLLIEGEVATDADVDGFTMTPADSAPVTTSEPLPVWFQQGETEEINGTRIVSKHGDLLDIIDIIAGLPVQVDGILDIDNENLSAALVILDTEVIDSEQLTGSLASVSDGVVTVNPDEDIVCGVATEEVEVSLLEDLKILTVVITTDTSEISVGGSLAEGQTIGINGSCTDTGYETDNVVIVDDQRS